MKHLFFTTTFLLLSVCNFAQSLTDSLKAYYPFSGNANDVTAYGNNGTVYGATLVQDRFGNPNSAYYFDGVNDYIEFTATPSIKPATFPISVSAWIRLLPNAAHSDFFISDFSGGKYYGVLMNTNPGTGFVQVTFGDGMGYCTGSYRRTKTGTTPVNDGQWHFVVGVIRGATDMDIYVDCQNDGGTYSGGGGSLAYSAATVGRIGMFECTGNNYQYNGDIDDLRFYHRQLSANDVVTLYNYPVGLGGNMAAGILGNDTSICSGNIVLDATTGWATNYNWSNGSTSPTLTISSPGTYWVSITGSACAQSGADTIIITGSTQASPIPDTVVCKNQIIVLNAPSGYTNYLWSTGATTQSISVSTSGMYIVQATNPNGCNLLDTIQVNAIPTNPPLAQFTYTLQPNGVIQLNNTSLYSAQYQWTYSNGGVDTAFSPQHNFPCNVPVTVTLISSGRCGADTATQTITYMCDAVEDMTEKIDLQVFPQPAQSVLNIAYQLSQPEKVRLTIHNALGQKVYEQIPSQQVGEIKNTISVEKWAEGYYFLQIVTEKGLATKKVWVTK